MIQIFFGSLCIANVHFILWVEKGLQRPSSVQLDVWKWKIHFHSRYKMKCWLLESHVFRFRSNISIMTHATASIGSGQDSCFMLLAGVCQSNVKYLKVQLFRKPVREKSNTGKTFFYVCVWGGRTQIPNSTVKRKANSWSTIGITLHITLNLFVVQCSHVHNVRQPHIWC